MRTGMFERAQPVADESQFGALGVESADDQRGATDALGERNRENLARGCRPRLRGGLPSSRGAPRRRPSGWAAGPRDRRASRRLRDAPARDDAKDLGFAAVRRPARAPLRPRSSAVFAVPTDAEQSLLEIAVARRVRPHP